ncbi:MAG TPA: flagellar biosynthesis anti-sigma factor FlgM [Syntrophorhabdaceae bacterium]|nr:flagellar biosynthesis anti-sigma factor FlgM [Syntrophorhabdaceae bacterium]HPU29298.1 flagellar biosynthesis anti-sigma factor FlgM [Syntrophorhabdaceae bacterium]
MKITNANHPNALENIIKSLENKPAKGTAAEEKNKQGITDKVELSTKRQEIQKLVDKVKAIPEVRMEKVEKIKEAIKSETYNVKGELVAKSILKSNILDEIL